jgi:hypothetical protein
LAARVKVKAGGKSAKEKREREREREAQEEEGGLRLGCCRLMHTNEVEWSGSRPLWPAKNPDTQRLLFWANQTPLFAFGRLDLRNPNSLDLADSLAGFSQYLEIQ